jgi:hypothetical protein
MEGPTMSRNRARCSPLNGGAEATSWRTRSSRSRLTRTVERVSAVSARTVSTTKRLEFGLRGCGFLLELACTTARLDGFQREFREMGLPQMLGADWVSTRFV